MDKFNRANIDAAGWLANKQQSRLGRNFTSENEFLLVAAGKIGTDVGRIRRAYIKCLHPCGAMRGQFFRIKPPAIANIVTGFIITFIIALIIAVTQKH